MNGWGEYMDGGRKVIIPGMETLKDLAEHAQIYDLIQQRKGRAALHDLDEILAEEGLSRDDLED
ncbi:MAG: hypothetical protein P4L55_12245 [Syntrophobacteraceae bacterium]|nr:hypothetical protein [Syntrophobacteraceae bacterium]